MTAVRSNRDFKRRMVGENRDGLIELGIHNLDQTPSLLRAKIATAVSWTQRVQRDQSDGIVFDRVIDEFGIRREIAARGKHGAQISSIVLVAGQHINWR